MGSHKQVNIRDDTGNNDQALIRPTNTAFSDEIQPLLTLWKRHNHDHHCILGERISGCGRMVRRRRNSRSKTVWLFRSSMHWQIRASDASAGRNARSGARNTMCSSKVPDSVLVDALPMHCVPSHTSGPLVPDLVPRFAGVVRSPARACAYLHGCLLRATIAELRRRAHPHSPRLLRFMDWNDSSSDLGRALQPHTPRIGSPS